MMKTAVLLIFLSISILVWTKVPTVEDLSNDLKTCHVDNKTELNKCVFDFWKDVKPILNAGINNGPSLDPMNLGDIILQEKFTYIKGKMLLSAVTIKGFGDYILKGVVVDIEKMIMTMDMFIPQIIAECTYDFNSTFMLVPIIGAGPFRTTFKDVKCEVTLHMQHNKVGGLYLTKTELDIVPASMKVRLHHLFGGLDVSKIIHDVLDDNIDLLYKDLRFTMGDEIATRGLHKVLKGAISQLVPEVFKL